ncbi:MAG: hypothetical protein K9G67_07215 [Bacteroidales bacterium]|nr:hypothetical protein [Bacteroidales bacterium]MCF8345545.1 hypothetical protein [Bacteroidales bacterium]MCF8376129.1 hypothetical protein [Bacteroidales bacterium]
MKKRLTIVLLSFFIILSFNATSQKWLDAVLNGAETTTRNTLDTLENYLNNIYTKDQSGNLQLDSIYIDKSSNLFYDYRDKSQKHINPVFIDHKDLMKDLPKLVNVERFLDTLVRWYCDNPEKNTSDIRFIIRNAQLDFSDYYIDPELIAVKAYFSIAFRGVFYRPVLFAKNGVDTTGATASDTVKSKEPTGPLSTDKLVKGERRSLRPVAAMGYFVIKRNDDGTLEPTGKIYQIKIQDAKTPPFVPQVIRPILQKRNTKNLTMSFGMGFSRLRADFNFNQELVSTIEGKPVYNVGISFDYYYNDGPQLFALGYSVGLGFSRLKSRIVLDEFKQNFPDFSEKLNKEYIKNVYASGVGMDLTLDYFDLPVSFKVKYKPYRENVNKNFHLNYYGDIGFVFSYLSNNSSGSSILKPFDGGEITYTGTFEYGTGNDTVPVTLEYLPYYGFATYTDLNYSETDPNFKSYNFSAMLDLGVMFSFRRVSLNFEVMYRYGFLNILETGNADSFILSEGEGKTNNIFLLSDKLNTKALIFNTGITYTLK